MDQYPAISIPDRYGLRDRNLGAAIKGISPYSHGIGSTLRIFPDSPASRVLDRRHGAFGAIYICEEVGSGLLHAFKTPRADRRSSTDLMEEFASEAAVWWSLPQHASVLTGTDRPQSAAL